MSGESRLALLTPADHTDGNRLHPGRQPPGSACAARLLHRRSAGHDDAVRHALPDITVSIVPDMAQPGRTDCGDATCLVKNAVTTRNRTCWRSRCRAPGDFRRPPSYHPGPEIPDRQVFQRCGLLVQARLSQRIRLPAGAGLSARQPVDFPVDYLARDFTSLTNALMDFSGAALSVVARAHSRRFRRDDRGNLAALGDEFAYIQDRAAREAYIDTAYERRSLRRLSTLIDYPLDDGQSATTRLQVTVAAGKSGSIAPGTLASATPLGQEPIPFETGNGLSQRAQEPPFFVNANWNAMSCYAPDPSQTCLPVGATELLSRRYLSANGRFRAGRRHRSGRLRCMGSKTDPDRVGPVGPRKAAAAPDRDPQPDRTPDRFLAGQQAHHASGME